MSAGDNNQNGIYGTNTSNSITIGNSNNDIFLNMNTGTYQIWNTPTTVAPNNLIWTITSPSHIKNSYIELPIGLLVKIKDFKSFLGIYL